MLIRCHVKLMDHFLLKYSNWLLWNSARSLVQFQKEYSFPEFWKALQILLARWFSFPMRSIQTSVFHYQWHDFWYFQNYFLLCSYRHSISSRIGMGQETGSLTLNATEDSHGFIVFGVCMNSFFVSTSESLLSICGEKAAGRSQLPYNKGKQWWRWRQQYWHSWFAECW